MKYIFIFLLLLPIKVVSQNLIATNNSVLELPSLVRVERGGEVKFPSGLISYYKLDEETGSKSFDSYINNIDGNLSGATINQTGKIGKSYSFDGVDDFVSLGTYSKFDFDVSDFSVSFWVKVASNHVTTEQAIVIKYGTGATPGFDVGISSNKIFAWIRDGIGSGTSEIVITYTNTLVNDDAWHFVVASYDRGGYLKVYIDGVEEGSQSIALITTTINNTKLLCIGKRDYTTPNCFAGGVDEVGFWDRALNERDVKILFNKGLGKTCPQNHASKNVLLIGNSVTVPILPLMIYIPYDVTSIAANGHTIDQQLAAWNALSAPLKASYDFVVINIGLNDALAVNADCITDCQALINAVNTGKKASCKIVCFTPTPACNYGDQTILTGLRNAIMGTGPTPITGVDIRSNLNYDELDLNDDNCLDVGFDSGDGVHPNLAGNQVIKSNILGIISSQ